MKLVSVRAPYSIAIGILCLFLTASAALALGSKEKSPSEEASDNEKKATEFYNKGVRDMTGARTTAAKGDSLYAFNYRATSDAKARKQYEKAVNNFQKAIELKPDMPEAYNNLGYSYRKLGKLDESLAAYDKAIALKSDFVQAREYRGETFLALGKLEKAQEELAFLQQHKSPYADTLARSIEVYQLNQVQSRQHE